MTNELFPIESVSQLSPRLQWLAKHRLLTAHYGEDETGEPWTAYTHRGIQFNTGAYYTGKTEDEAICNWAKANKVRLWNEEGLK